MRSYIITRFDRLHDLRFAALSADAERTYDRMYLLAGVLDADGFFIEHGRQLTYDEIAYRIRLQTQTVSKSIKELEKARIIHVNGKGPQILDWKLTQIDLNVKREKDRERQHRHRGVTRDTPVTDSDSNVSQSVTSIETKTKTKTQTKSLLLLLSKPAQEKLKANPNWIGEALEIANTKNIEDPVQYAAGIIRNWLTEGRKRAIKPIQAKKKTSAPKSDQPKLTGDALKAAREKAAKELLS